MSYKNSDLPNEIPFQSERYINIANNLTVDEIKETLKSRLKDTLSSLNDNEIRAYDLSITIYFTRMLCEKLDIDYNDYIKSFLKEIEK